MTKIKELQEELENASADADNALIRRDNLRDQLRGAETDLNQALKKVIEARFKLRAASMEKIA